MSFQFPADKLAKMVASCDERIAVAQTRMDKWKPYGDIMGLMTMFYEGDEEGKKVFSEAPNLDNIKTIKNNIELIKTEKLLYLALGNPNTKKGIFKVILDKYDALMGVSYDISGNMVLNGIEKEGNYLKYCKESLEQREYIRKMCCAGNGGFIH